MNIAVGCDHRGLTLKKQVVTILTEMGHVYKDYGCNTTESVDYPDYASAVAEAVAGKGSELGILICATGIGMSIAANKVKGIRAALCCEPGFAAYARRHNDANILCLGAERQQPVRQILESFVNTRFEGGRHLRRVNKIESMEC